MKCAPALTAVLLTLAPAIAAGPAYRQEVEAFRQRREAKLKADGGWLTVTGLYWLKEGENTVGSDPKSDVELPAGAPARLGSVRLSGTEVEFTAAVPGVTLEGKPVTTAKLKPGPEKLSIGPLDLLLIQRGARFGLRLKDKNSALRKNFTRLSWYPVDEKWRVRGRLIRSAAPAPLVLDTVIGVQSRVQSPGSVEFELRGRKFRLLAIDEDDRLFFVFRDLTSGRTTYGASRFLYADAGPDGTVMLDFNQAENPPCAFTPYATCPLPPPQNRLPVAIEAGEKKYEGAAH